MRRLAAAWLALCLCLGAGLALAEELRITGLQWDEHGSARLSWEGGTAPFHVVYRCAEMETAHLWQEDENGVRARQYTLTSLAPDTAYLVWVTDAEGAWTAAELPAGGRSFDSVPGLRMTMTLRQRSAGRASTVGSFKAASIQQGLAADSQYGATIKLSYKRVNTQETYRYRMAMVLPGGETLVMHSMDDKLYRSSGSQYSFWEFYDFSPFWRLVADLYDGIPTGTYTFKLFMDDGLVAATPIEVR